MNETNNPMAIGPKLAPSVGQMRRGECKCACIGLLSILIFSLIDSCAYSEETSGQVASAATSFPITPERGEGQNNKMAALHSHSSPEPAKRSWGCNRDSEFACPSERRCIPISWHCDFTEQCLTGEDEFGCAAERCNFGQDLCNWTNELGPLIDSGNPPACRPSVWRRYRAGPSQAGGWPVEVARANSMGAGVIVSLGSGGEGEKINAPARIAGNANLAEQRAPALAQRRAAPLSHYDPLAAAVSELGGKLKQGSRFVFVPLTHETEAGESETTTTTTSSATDTTAAGRRDARGATMAAPKSNELGSIKSARFIAPLISRTNSMCQLRFRYAMWINSSESRGSRAKLTLSLLDRGGQTSAGPANASLKILWSKSIQAIGADGTTRLANIGRSSLRSPSFSSRGSEADWLLEVVELGHMEAARLEFEAELRLESINVPAKAAASISMPRFEPGAAGPPTSVQGGSQRGQQRHYALVALNWLKFQDCAWPLGARPANYLTGGSAQRLRLPAATAKDTSSNLMGGSAGAAAAAEGASSSAASAPARPCASPREFQCTNHICLEGHKVCNFVDDCMSGGGGSTDSEQRAHGGRDEDESKELCAHILGKENFEQHLVGLNISLAIQTPGALEALKRPDKRDHSTPFWTLASNWPQDKIRIESSLARASHLPRRDHTRPSSPASPGRSRSSSEAGHYLSLEIPSTGATSNSGSSGPKSSQLPLAPPGPGDGNENFFWIYLSSPWMKKNKEAGDCRVKLFYNLVSANPLSQTTPPFKLYLALEHFVLNRRRPSEGGGDLGEKVKGAEELPESGTSSPPKTARVVDNFMHSHLANLESSSGSGVPSAAAWAAERVSLIEFPGVDFWREFNFKLANLGANDIFYTGVAMLVEITNSTLPMATLNIDDISTHFGCQLANEKELISYGIGEHDLNAYNHHHRYHRFNPSDYSGGAREGTRKVSTSTSVSTSSILDYYNRRRKRNPQDPNGITQLEPHKLIMCVVLMLSFMAGLILVIVFILVPYVERLAINYHDQLTAGLSGMACATPPRNSLENSPTELTGANDSDWEQVSKRWRRTALSGGIMSESEVTILDSQFHRSQAWLSSNSSFVNLVNNTRSVVESGGSSSGSLDANNATTSGSGNENNASTL